MSVRFVSAGFALLPVIALLAACDSAAPEADAEAARAASGEVLQGSISDAMLPLETLRSQPPVAAPLPGEVVAAPAGEGAAEPEADGAEPAGADDAAAEPASEPAAAQ